MCPRSTGGRADREGTAATTAVTELLARVGHATIDFAASAEVERLGFCDAPSCGRFFLRDRTDQQWCGRACGTRVRLARHTARR